MMIYKNLIKFGLYYSIARLLEHFLFVKKLPINEEIYQPKYRDFEQAVKDVKITSSVLCRIFKYILLQNLRIF